MLRGQVIFHNVERHKYPLVIRVPLCVGACLSTVCVCVCVGACEVVDAQSLVMASPGPRLDCLAMISSKSRKLHENTYSLHTHSQTECIQRSSEEPGISGPRFEKKVNINLRYNNTTKGKVLFKCHANIPRAWSAKLKWTWLHVS